MRMMEMCLYDEVDKDVMLDCFFFYGEHLCYEDMQLQHMTIHEFKSSVFSCRKDHVSIGL